VAILGFFLNFKNYFFGDFFCQNNRELAFLFPKKISQNGENSLPKKLIHLALSCSHDCGASPHLIANHLNQSLYLTNQKHAAVVVRSYLLHSSLAGAELCLCLVPASAANCPNLLGQTRMF
jgi:hypothetical protein